MPYTNFAERVILISFEAFKYCKNKFYISSSAMISFLFKYVRTK